MKESNSVENTPSPRLNRLGRIYKVCALIVFNTLVLFLLFNLVLGMAFAGRDWWKASQVTNPPSAFFKDDGSPIDNGKRNAYPLKWFDYKACSELPQENVGQVLDDFDELAKLGFLYQPWVQFAERPFQGKRVSVQLDEMGFPNRTTVNSPADSRPVIHIYTLGGSTTFGYNVADEHTWPSCLSQALNQQARTKGLSVRVQVTNFGRGFYNSSQELALLIDLLKSGHRPNLVVFLDGVNEGGDMDVPHFSVEVGRAFCKAQTPDPKDTRPLPLVGHLPIMKLADFIKDRAAKLGPAQVAPAGDTPSQVNPTELVRRYQANRRLSARICLEYGVKPLFCVQPAADYNYPLTLYRLKVPESFLAQRKVKQSFYPALESDKEVVYLGDLFKSYGSERKAILDDCHYTPDFNRFVAQAIAARIDLQSLKPAGQEIDPGASTGAKRNELVRRMTLSP